MTIRRFIAMSMTVAFLAITSFAEKNSAHCNQGNGDGKGNWSNLNLTADQQQKIKALNDEMMAARKAHRDEIQVVRQKVIVELKKSNPSQSSLDNYAREFGDLNAKLSQERTTHLLKIKAVLTPEQFNQMVEQQSAGCRDGKGGKAGQGNHGCATGTSPSSSCTTQSSAGCATGTSSCATQSSAGCAAAGKTGCPSSKAPGN